MGTTLLAAAGLLWAVLPGRELVHHWSLAWVGLDVASATIALVTALLVYRGDPRAALTAAAGAALLVLDAWFDVTTAGRGSETWIAVGEAALVELPLAVLAAGFAVSSMSAALRAAGRYRADHVDGQDPLTASSTARP